MPQDQRGPLCSVWQVDGTATPWTASAHCQHVHKLLRSSGKLYSSSGFAVCSSARGLLCTCLDASYMPRCKACLHRLSACGRNFNSIDDTAIDICSMRMQQLFSLPKRLLQCRNVIPTLKIQIQKCLGTVKMCFYIVEMF